MPLAQNQDSACVQGVYNAQFCMRPRQVPCHAATITATRLANHCNCHCNCCITPQHSRQSLRLCVMFYYTHKHTFITVRCYIDVIHDM